MPSRAPGRPRLVDHHAHSSEFSADSSVAMHALVRAVAERGFAPSISDHWPSGDPWFGRMRSLADLPDYLDALERASAETGVRILRGLELDLGVPGNTLDPATLDRLDHLVGGFHRALPSLADGSRAAAMHRVLDVVEGELERQPVDILAHATRYMDGDGREAGEIPGEVANRLVGLLARTGTALEINGKSGHPPDAIVRRALEAGVQLSVGTDLHDLRTIERALAHPTAVMRRFGVDPTDLFDARVPKAERASAARWRRAIPATAATMPAGGPIATG